MRVLEYGMPILYGIRGHMTLPIFSPNTVVRGRGVYPGAPQPRPTPQDPHFLFLDRDADCRTAFHAGLTKEKAPAATGP
jgi:hypothetical protein